MGVKLIAGPSNVGKSTAATVLAQAGGARVLEVDDLARCSSDPALAFERDPTVWAQPPSALRDLLIGKGEALWPEIERWIAASASADRQTIIEGEGPSPSQLLRAAKDHDARAVFVVESNPRRLFHTVFGRSESFRRLPPLQQHNVTQMNVLYGEWLRDQCEVTSLPCLESQPWATLANRCARALH